MKYLIRVEDGSDFAAEIEVQDDDALLREAGRIITDIIGDEFAARSSGEITLTASTPDNVPKLICAMRFRSEWMDGS